MADDELDYEILVDNALRMVVRGALDLVARRGRPEGHHFYITFRTGEAGVDITDALKAQYPEEMTIVLQHQFSGLAVTDTGFQVTLNFAGVPRTLVVPFAAVTTFADPDAKFVLQFRSPSGGEAATSKEVGRESDPAPRDDGNIVALDTFRKK